MPVPEELLYPLYPLEVADNHPAGVAQNVGNNKYFVSALVEHSICFGCRRPVRPLGQHSAAQALGDLRVDHPFDRGGHEDVALLSQKFVRIEGEFA